MTIERHKAADAWYLAVAMPTGLHREPIIAWDIDTEKVDVGPDDVLRAKPGADDTPGAGAWPVTAGLTIDELEARGWSIGCGHVLGCFHPEADPEPDDLEAFAESLKGVTPDPERSWPKR